LRPSDDRNEQEGKTKDTRRRVEKTNSVFSVQKDISLTVCVNRSTSLKKKKICTGSHIGRDQSYQKKQQQKTIKMRKKKKKLSYFIHYLETFI